MFNGQKYPYSNRVQRVKDYNFNQIPFPPLNTKINQKISNKAVMIDIDSAFSRFRIRVR